jgi:nucleolar protein 15
LIDNAVKAVDDALAKTKAPGKHADNTSANDILPQQELQVEKKGKKKGKTAAASVVETKQFPSGKTEITKVEIVKTEAEAAPDTIEPPKQLSKEERKAKKVKKMSESKKNSKEERLQKWKALSKEQKMEKRKPSNGDDDNDEEDVEDEDDQTAALLAGFESEGDESDDEQENSKINVAALKKQVPEGLLEKLEGVSSKGKETGVVFVGYVCSILRVLHC